MCGEGKGLHKYRRQKICRDCYNSDYDNGYLSRTAYVTCHGSTCGEQIQEHAQAAVNNFRLTRAEKLQINEAMKKIGVGRGDSILRAPLEVAASNREKRDQQDKSLNKLRVCRGAE
jgi:hypothetical protein